MTDTARNLHAGIYTVVILDNNTCTVSTPVTVTGGAVAMAVTPLITNLRCYNDNNGAVDLHVSGGVPPYRYDWSNGSNTAALKDIPAGTYNLTVTDNGDCMSQASIIVTQPDPIRADLASPLYPGGYNVSAYNMKDGIITCTVTGGTAPYTCTWSTGANTPNLQDLPAGLYTVNVTDADGCTAPAKVLLKQPVPIDLPQGFSPNGDGDNDFFVILGLDNFPENDLQIFNRWGNLVYSAENYRNNWNGTNKNDEPLPEGTYYVVLRLGKETKRAAYVELRR
jgi:gliding motility-associated-like protein